MIILHLITTLISNLHAINVCVQVRRYQPFASGSRNCVGMPQAQVTMQATLAALLSRFRFRLADQARPSVLMHASRAGPELATAYYVGCKASPENCCNGRALSTARPNLDGTARVWWMCL